MRRKTFSPRVIGFLLFAAAAPANAADVRQDKSELPAGTIQVFPTDIVWKDAPPTMPPGTQVSVLEGNPKEEGIFTLRLKVPPNARLAPHTHPKPERVTVIEGLIHVGFGGTPDAAKGTSFGAGAFYVNPPDAPHYVWTGAEGAIVQITGQGPWEVRFVAGEKK